MSDRSQGMSVLLYASVPCQFFFFCDWLFFRLCVAPYYLLPPTQNDNGKWVVEWDYENLLSLHSENINMRVTRVGFIRYAAGIKPEEEEDVVKALRPFGCVPVFLERTLARKFYRDFCKVNRRCICICSCNGSLALIRAFCQNATCWANSKDEDGGTFASCMSIVSCRVWREL